MDLQPSHCRASRRTLQIERCPRSECHVVRAAFRAVTSLPLEAPSNPVRRIRLFRCGGADLRDHMDAHADAVHGTHRCGRRHGAGGVHGRIGPRRGHSRTTRAGVDVSGSVACLRRPRSFDRCTCSAAARRTRSVPAAAGRHLRRRERWRSVWPDALVVRTRRRDRAGVRHGRNAAGRYPLACLVEQSRRLGHRRLVRRQHDRRDDGRRACRVRADPVDGHENDDAGGRRAQWHLGRTRPVAEPSVDRGCTVCRLRLDSNQNHTPHPPVGLRRRPQRVPRPRVWQWLRSVSRAVYR